VGLPNMLPFLAYSEVHLVFPVQIVFFVVLLTVWGVRTCWVRVVKYSGACI